MKTKLAPHLHLNGSGIRNLMPAAEAVYTALHAADEAMCQLAPHGRDYYPLAPGAYEEAHAEYIELRKSLATVIDSVEAHIHHLHAEEERTRRK